MGILNLNSPEPVAEPTHELGPDETPPGLQAIRAWLRKPRPWVRGVRLWFRQIAKWWRAFRKWAAKNAVPAARRAMEWAERGAQGARKVARAAEFAGEIGGHAAAIGREWRKGNGRVGRAVVKGAESARDWSVRTARSAKEVAAIADVVARARTLLPDRVRSGARPEVEDEVAGPGRRFVPRPGRARRKPPAKPKSEAPPALREPPAEESEKPNEPIPETTEAPSRSDADPATPPDRESQPSTATGGEGRTENPERLSTTPSPDERRRAAELEKFPWYLQAEINALRPKTRKSVLWPLIVRIVKQRGPTTSAALALILGLESRSLMRRHVGPMVKKGMLVRLYPDHPRHPEQAYRVKGEVNP
ncbi:MAG: hypothetical protein OYK82_07690 [Gammaproteobacteria bacterium]|nr:hypothetical protein [Gammaproteobacteria bacterium]